MTLQGWCKQTLAHHLLTPYDGTTQPKASRTGVSGAVMDWRGQIKLCLHIVLSLQPAHWGRYIREWKKRVGLEIIRGHCKEF